MTERRTVADVILAVAPEMAELVRLREQVIVLRKEKHPPTPNLETLISGLPITVKQADDGTWFSTINTGPQTGHSGSGPHTTDLDAFRAGVEHACHLIGEAWAREAEDDEDDA